MPILSKKEPKLAIPKTDSKKERKARQRASKRFREANRQECLRLDDYKCRVPWCDCNNNPDIECAIIDSHHLLGKTKDNRWDAPKFRISLSRRCHNKYDKEREEMIKVLEELRKTAADFRWHTALKGLEEKWYLK